MVLLLTSVVAGYFWYRSACAALERELAWARQQGYPTNRDELEAWYKEPPTGQNAVDHYLRAFVAIQDAPVPSTLPVAPPLPLPEPKEPFPEKLRSEYIEYIGACEEATQELIAGSQCPFARYPLADPDRVPGTLEPPQGLYKAVDLLTLASVMHADQDQPAQATTGLLTASRVASSADDAPSMAFQLSRYGCNCEIVRALRQVIHRTRLDDAQLKALGEALAQAEADGKLHIGLAGETVLGADWLHKLQAQGQPVVTGKKADPFRSNLALLGPFGIDRLDEAYLRSVVREWIRIAQLPVEQRQAAAEAYKPALENPPWYAVRSYAAGFGPGREVEMSVGNAAGLRCAVAAVAVERHLLTQGDLPSSLEALVPKYLSAIPADPYDGRPLRYLGEKKSYVVYSVGPDLQDQRGHSMPRNGAPFSGMAGDDVAFRVDR